MSDFFRSGSHAIGLKALSARGCAICPAKVKVQVKVPVSIAGLMERTVPRRHGGTTHPPNSTYWKNKPIGKQWKRIGNPKYSR